MEFAEFAGSVILFLLMLLVGLELSPADFQRVLQSPRAVIGGTLAQWILLPLMTWLVVYAVDVNPVFGAGAILVAVAPGAGVSNVFTAVARANTALSVTLTATASVFAVVTLPMFSSLAVRLFLDESLTVEVPVGLLIGQLAVTLLLPITFGMLVRTRFPAEAQRLAPYLQRFTALLIAIVVAVLIAVTPEEQTHFEGSGRALIAAALWTVSAMAIGWGTARALRLPSEDRFTFLIEFSARNVAVAVIVGISGLGRVDLSFFAGVYMVVGYPLAAAAVLWRRRRLRSHGRSTG